MAKYNIVVDTREKNPIDCKDFESCASVVSKKLDHGDYAIEGLEKLIFIDRKASVSELAGNITTKRFAKLIDAASQFKYKYLLLEFSASDVFDFPYGAGLPKSVVRKIRVRGPFIMSALLEYAHNHNIQILFCSNKLHAKKMLASLLDKIYKSEILCTTE
jgi:ERCC4-type nuclease